MSNNLLDCVITTTELNQKTADCMKKIKENKCAVVMKNNKPEFIMMTYDEYKRIVENEK